MQLTYADSLLKDSSGLTESLKEQNIAPDETLLSFDVSAFSPVIQYQ